jgi:hypothetical protein
VHGVVCCGCLTLFVNQLGLDASAKADVPELAEEEEEEKKEEEKSSEDGESSEEKKDEL